MISPWLEITVGISIAVGAAFLIFIGKLMITFCKNAKIFFHKVLGALEQINEMRKEGSNRKREVQLLFKAQLVQLDIMSGEEINGQVAELRREIEQYTIYN